MLQSIFPIGDTCPLNQTIPATVRKPLEQQAKLRTNDCRVPQQNLQDLRSCPPSPPILGGTNTYFPHSWGIGEAKLPILCRSFPLTTGLQILLTDFHIIFERDPAARNWLEVLCCYPGLHALVLHRLAHWLHKKGVRFIPRLISHLARFLTGIEIHPGAVIGQGVFIDHGMGVVIGETAIVGDYTLIYQGATLGGTGKQSGKRHPTVGENVVVGAGAKVLGNIKIGDRVRIGAGSVVLRNVPDYCTVVGVPGRIVRRSNQRINPLEHGQLPDTEAAVIRRLVDRIEQLEEQLQNLQRVNSQNNVYTL